MHSSIAVLSKSVGHIPTDALCEKSVDRLLNAIGVDPTTRITVAGPLAGAAMSVLWRRGIEQVEAARGITSPSADQQSQVLLIVGCDSVQQITEITCKVLPILGLEGTIGVDVNRIAALGDRVRVCRMLAHRGLRYRPGVEFSTEIIAHKPGVEDVFDIAS